MAGVLAGGLRHLPAGGVAAVPVRVVISRAAGVVTALTEII
jgi:hypothetical protein